MANRPKLGKATRARVHVTGGLFAASLVALTAESALVSVLANLAVSLIWVWEESE